MRQQMPKRAPWRLPEPATDIVDIAETARQLDAIADLLTIDGATPLLSQSYRRIAARIKDVVPKTLPGEEFDRLIVKIPGIGADIVTKVLAVAHGMHPNLMDAFGKMFPATLTSLLLLPDLGPRRVNLLYNELGIGSIDALEDAAAAGKLRSLPGFGPALEQRLLTTIRHRKKTIATLHGPQPLHAAEAPPAAERLSPKNGWSSQANC